MFSQDTDARSGPRNTSEAESESLETAEQTAVAARVLHESVGVVVVVRTAGGGEFQGRLLSVGDNRIELQDGEGLIMQIAVEEITGVYQVGARSGRDVFFQDAAGNKLIVMPLGFGMDPGELHVADQEVVVVSVSYGVSRSFSLWGALSIPGLLLNARFSMQPTERFGLSLGSFAGITFTDTSLVALPYAIGSVGTLHENVTVGLGVPVFLPEIFGMESITTGGVLALGGKIVLAKGASIVTENWVLVTTRYDFSSFSLPNVHVIPTVAFRIAGSRFSWDVGITMPFGFTWTDYEVSGAQDGYAFDWFPFGNAIPLPILGFTYRVQ